MNITGFSKYVFDGKAVFSKERMYPLTPSYSKVKGFARFFMVDDSGNSHMLSLKNLTRLVKYDTKISSSKASPSPSPAEGGKTRGKRVLNRSTGAVYGSMKAASEASGLSLAKLKSSENFEILG